MSSVLDHSVQETAHSELAAVEEGYGPLHREVAEYLGRQSMANSEIETRQAAIEAENANAKLITSFAQALPHTRRYRFELNGENPQYDARQIQANTVWSHGQFPYYVVGRAPDKEDKDTVNLLLVPPVDDGGGYREDRRPFITPIRKDDLELSDTLRVEVEGRELTHDEIDSMMDPNNGRLYLEYAKGASVGISFKNYWGKASLEKITKEGIRTTGGYRPHRGLSRISSEMLAEYEVPTHLAKLATAFGTEGKLRALIGKDQESEHEQTDRQPTMEEVLQQNVEMKAALKHMMLASGVVDEQEVDRLLEARYPSFSISS